MEKWEYLFVTANLDGVHWKVWAVDGSPISNWRQDKNLAQYANQLGAEGWELVTAINTGDDEPDFRLIFKRPKP